MDKRVFWYENLTEEQSEQLRAFKAHLIREDILVSGLDDELSLLRFLKARQWDPKRAAKMYAAMRTWRLDMHVDELTDSYMFEEVEAVRRAYPHCYHKTDKWGRPVYVELLGKVDVDKLLSITTMERFIKYHVQSCELMRRERLPACSALAGRRILTTTIILDLAGFNMSRFNLNVKRFLQVISEVDQNYFPEHLGAMYIINAPLVFRSIWTFVKPFLDERTLNKIKVLGADYKEELLAVIPEANLPCQFGGASDCDMLHDEGPTMPCAALSPPAHAAAQPRAAHQPGRQHAAGAAMAAVANAPGGPQAAAVGNEPAGQCALAAAPLPACGATAAGCAPASAPPAEEDAVAVVAAGCSLGGAAVGKARSSDAGSLYFTAPNSPSPSRRASLDQDRDLGLGQDRQDVTAHSRLAEVLRAVLGGCAGAAHGPRPPATARAS